MIPRIHLHVPPALRHRRFRLLWLGMMISVAGTEMQMAALLWQMKELTGEAIYLGGIGLARILPVIIFSLIGGAMADVVNRRKVLFVTQTIMALAALVLAALTFTGHITFWHLYILTAIQAMAVAFDAPARQSLVPNLVPVKDLPNAFSMNSIAYQTGFIVGPALSGPVIALLGEQWAYLFNAFSYGAVLLALLLMGSVAQQIAPGVRPAVSRKAILEGINFIRHQPIILSTMLTDFFATFFSTANNLLPIFVDDVLHLGEVEYGFLLAAPAIGAVLAAMVVSQLKEIRRQGPVFLGSVVVFGLAHVVFGLSTTFLVAMLALILVGASDSVSTIIRNTIRQLQTPDYIRGRMTSVNQIFFMGGPQLGDFESGVVAQFFGTPFAIVSGGIGCILAVAWIANRWPQLRTYNGDEPAMAGAVAD